MELVYTDNNLNDLGVLNNWSIDLAFGSDENDFELQITMSNSAVNSIDVGGYIYLTDTGYGGVIDSKETVTGDNKIYLRGRSFEGILDGMVIQPSSGAAYYVANGDCNTIISDLITYCGLGDTFMGYSKKCGTEISNYLIRYSTLYEGLYQALLSVNKKLKFEPVSVDGATKFQISAVDIIDFSASEEWNSDNINVDITQYQQQVNHLICLGSGTLAERHVIHLFSDGSGNVQTYATTDTPIKDADYILDESKKVYSGIAEITEVYDYPNIESIDNYVLLDEEPDDWSNQTQFYIKDGTSFTALDFNYLTKYKLQTAQPSDWATAYGNYYEISDSAYTAVAGAIDHQKQTAEPDDWEDNYSSYYTQYDDGASHISYNPVEGVTYYHYYLTTTQPSDWASNYTQYYSLQSTYKAVTAATYTGTITESIPPSYLADYAANPIYSNYKLSGTLNKMTGVYGVGIDDLTFWREQYSFTSTCFAFEMSINLPQLITYLNAAQAKANTYAKSQTSANYKALSAAVTTVNNYVASASFTCVFEINSKHTSITIWLCRRSLAYLTFGYTYTYQAAPAWQPNTYYSREPYKVAPNWDDDDYYTAVTVPPTWVIGKYYTNYVDKEPHDFETDTYYRLYTDHFYNLVLAGIEKLADLRSQDKIEATIESSNTYDVGDVIAINDGTTGINITQRITKKIVSASDNDIKINYTLGG